MKTKWQVAVLSLALAVAALGLDAAAPAGATIIHESAVLGPTGRSFSVPIGRALFLGSRFSLSQAVTVNAIGGHFVGFPGFRGGRIFGAIVGLSSATALPEGRRWDGEGYDGEGHDGDGHDGDDDGYRYGLRNLFAHTRFVTRYPSRDILVPLSVTLPAGHYALIFGSGLFGARGIAAMPTGNIDIPSHASYFYGTRRRWVDGGFSGTRFVVAGTPVRGAAISEPWTLLTFGFGLIVLGLLIGRRKTA